jgi:flagellar L-ring protein precursor FlgH
MLANCIRVKTMNGHTRTTAALMVILLSACSSVDPGRNTFGSEFELIYPSDPMPLRVSSGSIMDNGINLYPTRRIYQSGHVKVGDIITVVLNETAQASRSSALTAERETSNNILGANQANSIFPGSSFFDGASAAGSSLSSNGRGTAGQSASLTGSISAVVVDIMQNGNLVILGEKQLTLTEGTEVIRLKGVVRPEDIQPDNTILSRRIANAQFSYSGTGDLARAAKPPAGLRTLFSIWPF